MTKIIILVIILFCQTCFAANIQGKRCTISRAGANQSVTSSADTIVDMDTVVVNDSAKLFTPDLTANTITVNFAGRVKVKAFCSGGTDSANATWVIGHLYKNATLVMTQRSLNVFNIYACAFIMEWELDANVGDVFSLYEQINGTSPWIGGDASNVRLTIETL